MTTLATDTPRDQVLGNVNSLPVIASDIIYQGAAVGDNGSGYARPLTSGDPFRGFAQAKADNSSGSAGDIDVLVIERGIMKLAISGVAITDVGKPVYATDDNTFVISGLGTKIGYVRRYVASGYAEVAFDATYAGQEEIVYVSSAVTLASIADGDVITTYTPGFAGRIIDWDFVTDVPVTTADKASTLNLEVGTTDVTGGTISLTSAACTPQGAIISGTAITAGGAFGASDTISVEASSTTTFIEGTGTLILKLGR